MERQNDVFGDVVTYNTNIWKRFIDCSLDNIQKEPTLGNSLDLLKAINSYRSFPLIPDLLKAYPELIEQKKYIDLLWAHFDKQTQEQLSDIFFETLHELM